MTKYSYYLLLSCLMLFGGLPNRRTACHRLYVTGGCKFPAEFETGSHCQ